MIIDRIGNDAAYWVGGVALERKSPRSFQHMCTCVCICVCGSVCVSSNFPAGGRLYSARIMIQLEELSLPAAGSTGNNLMMLYSADSLLHAFASEDEDQSHDGAASSGCRGECLTHAKTIVGRVCVSVDRLVKQWVSQHQISSSKLFGRKRKNTAATTKNEENEREISKQQR